MNAESLVAANPDILDGVDDLMQLSYLNEPSVLYNIQYRYNQDMIYVSFQTGFNFKFYFLLSFLVLISSWVPYFCLQCRQKRGQF